MGIQQEYKKLNKVLKATQAAIYELQSECSHPYVHKEYHANTGNYDPSSDSYWINCYCPDCEKRWTEDQ